MLLYDCRTEYRMPKSPAYEREVKSLIDNDVQSAISYSKSKWIDGKVAE
jgi:hypothetical protein